MEPASTDSKPWGYKIISYLYFEGEPSQGQIDLITGQINNVTPSAVFHGMAIETVKDKPYDQVAS